MGVILIERMASDFLSKINYKYWLDSSNQLGPKYCSLVKLLVLQVNRSKYLYQ